MDKSTIILTRRCEKCNVPIEVDVVGDPYHDILCIECGFDELFSFSGDD